MSGFLSDLGARAVSDAAVARPRPRSLFEPERPAKAVPPVPGAAGSVADDRASRVGEPPGPAAVPTTGAGPGGTSDLPPASAGEAPGSQARSGPATPGAASVPTTAGAARAVLPASGAAPAQSVAPVVQRRGADRPPSPAARSAEPMPASAADPAALSPLPVHAPAPAAAIGDAANGRSSLSGAAAPSSAGGLPSIDPSLRRTPPPSARRESSVPPPADTPPAIEVEAAPPATAGSEGEPSAPVGSGAPPAPATRPAILAPAPDGWGDGATVDAAVAREVPRPALPPRAAAGQLPAGPPAPPSAPVSVPPPSPAATAPTGTPAETVVEVRIGRIEVRVEPAARRPAAPSSPRPPISLAEYLGGRGRR